MATGYKPHYLTEDATIYFNAKIKCDALDLTRWYVVMVYFMVIQVLLGVILTLHEFLFTHGLQNLVST